MCAGMNEEVYLNQTSLLHVHALLLVNVGLCACMYWWVGISLCVCVHSCINACGFVYLCFLQEFEMVDSGRRRHCRLNWLAYSVCTLHK